MKTYFNFGCGKTFHPEWSNFDFTATPPDVLFLDIANPLPIPDGQAEVIYHSNVLEHLDQDQGRNFLAECHRVLKPGGIMRVGIPDLEQIVRQYLAALDTATKQGDAAAAENYDWALIEMFDQIWRVRPGGKMGQQIASADGALKKHIIKRLGMEALPYYKNNPAGPRQKPPITWQRIKNFIQRSRERVAIRAVGVIAGGYARKGAEQGIFRGKGEIHRHMYDAYSLSKVLLDLKFAKVMRMTAETSNIPGFARYELDCVGQQYRKPDSIYIEAIKA